MKKTVKNLLLSAVGSRKLMLLLAYTALNIANSKLNLGINEDDVVRITGAFIAWLLGQSGIDMIKEKNKR